MEKEMECLHSREFDVGFRHKAIDRARGVRRIPRVKGNRHMDGTEDNKVNISGGDALRGHTRSHPEHDG